MLFRTSNYGALPAASETSSESQHPGNQREDAFQAEINRNNNSTSTDTRNNQQQRSRHQRQLAAANAAFNATQARLRATLTRHKALDDIFNVLGASCNSALAEVSKRKDARTGKSKINSPSDTRIERTVPDLFSDTRLLSGKLVDAVEQEASSRLPEQELTLRRLFVQELCLGVMLGQSPDIKRRPSESLQVAITDSDDGDGTPGNDDDVPLPIITSANSPTAG
ncbi:unnamed protein product [Notodromas monacha]|uniref:Uncharacterized protein n=1 Tax=Notodromas monacha TaxID=399045 RepID=A0A7R9BRF9_9CRUS|nr:unnamed protein product [Notodromas monacha]CAG0919984.1 unnamed protein product [Notodromas monacha]